MSKRSHSKVWSSQDEKKWRKKRKLGSSQLSYGKPTQWQGRPRGPLNRRVGGFTDVDLKYIEKEFVSVIPASLTGTGTLLGGVLNGVAQGNGQSERIGTRMYMHNLQVRGVIRIQGYDNVTNPVLPVINCGLLLDTQTNSVAENGVNVWQTVANVDNIANMYRDLEHSTRFKILKRRQICTAKYVTTNAFYNTLAPEYSFPQTEIPFNFFVNLKDLMVQYVSGGAGIADIQDMSVWFFCMSTHVGAHSGVPTVVFQSRLRFRG